LPELTDEITTTRVSIVIWC